MALPRKMSISLCLLRPRLHLSATINTLAANYWHDANKYH